MAVNLLLLKGARHRVIVREGDRARRDRHPAAIFDRNFAGADPWALRAAFAAGVGDLHAGDGALRLQKSHDARQKLDVLVLPNSQILGTDAALGRDGGRFGENQAAPPAARLPRCTRCQSLREAVLAGILAHRGNDNAILQSDSANRQGIEYLSHSLLVKILSVERNAWEPVMVRRARHARYQMRS